MKQLMMAATMVGALTCAAANQTYTWPDVGEELTVTYDTEDATKVKAIVADVAKGDTVTLIGDAIPLAEDPTITVKGGSLVISNTLDGTGTLSFQPQAYEATASWMDDTTYLQLDPDWTLIFPGKNLDEWQPVTSQGPADGHNPNAMKVYNVSRYVSNEVSYADIQVQYGYTSGSKYAVKCIWAKLKQTENGIAAIVERCGAFTQFEESVEGEDISYYAEHTGTYYKDYPRTLMTQSVDSGGKKGYGINQLTMKYIGALPTVRLEGLVTNSTNGAYLPVSVEAGIAVKTGSASGINRLPAGVSISNAGVFTAEASHPGGLDNYGIVTNLGPIASSETFRYARGTDMVSTDYESEGWLSTNWFPVAVGRSLLDVTNLTGTLDGAWIGAKGNSARMYHYTPSPSGLTATGQVQGIASSVRIIHVEFRSNGPFIEVRGLKGRNESDTQKLGNNFALGTIKVVMGNVSGVDTGYGLNGFKVQFRDSPCGAMMCGMSPHEDLSLSDSSAIEITGSEAGRTAVMFCRTNSMPENGTVDVYAGGDMILEPNPGISSLDVDAYASGTCRIRVHEGGTLYQWGPWSLGPNQIVELRAGTLHSGDLNRPMNNLGRGHINHLYLYDGAAVTGQQFRVGHLPEGNVGWWKVRGSLPAHCYPTVNLESGAKNKQSTIKWDVWDVTGDDEADLVMHGPFRRYVSDWAHTNVLVRKTGAGTMLFQKPCGNNNEPMGPIDLEEGTWLLGVSNTVGPGTPFRLKGGTLGAAAGTANSCGPLWIYPAGGAISLGEGATLAFADSSAMSWTATQKVTVYGFAERAIRFGESKAAVPRTRMFKLPDGTSLRVDDDGYLTAIPIGTVMAIR